MARILRLRRTWLLVAVAVYTGLMLFGGCASKLILYPSVQPIDAQSARQQFVELGEGRRVECWVDRSPGARGGSAKPEAYVIEFTGNATRAEQIATWGATRWRGRSVECWAVNYPGYGASTGPAQLEGVAPAALAVYDHIARGDPGKPIFAGGNSLGTAAALHVAAQRRCAGVILQNPPALRSLVLAYGWWNLWLVAGPIAMQIPAELDSPANAAKLKIPALFVLASEDQLVSPANQKKVLDAYAGPKRVVTYEGGHNDPIAGEAQRRLQAEIEWLWDTAMGK